MEAIYILIPLAVLIVAFAVWIFFWAVDNGQFEDLDKEAHRILFDDDQDKIPETPASSTAEKSEHKDAQ